MNQLPLAIGLLLCDLVIVDDKTHRLTPVNCFAPREIKIDNTLIANRRFLIVAKEDNS